MKSSNPHRRETRDKQYIVVRAFSWHLLHSLRLLLSQVPLSNGTSPLHLGFHQSLPGTFTPPRFAQARSSKSQLNHSLLQGQPLASSSQHFSKSNNSNVQCMPLSRLVYTSKKQKKKCYSINLMKISSKKRFDEALNALE